MFLPIAEARGIHNHNLSMIEYVISDGHGMYIKYSSGKYVPVRGEQYATRFAERGKAANILKSSVAKNIRDKFRVLDIEIPKTSTDSPAKELPTASRCTVRVNKDVGILKDVLNRHISDDETISILAQINELGELVKYIERRIPEVQEALKTVNNAIVDMQHHIEFGKFDLYRGYLTSKNCQHLFQLRRKYKDELVSLYEARKCKLDSASILRLYKALDGLSERKYQPRVLTELFEETKIK